MIPISGARSPAIAGEGRPPVIGGTWPLVPSVMALTVALGAIMVAGRALAATADVLADRTGMGKAVAGALLLGTVTSLPGIGTTDVGSLNGDAQFALANPIGGIAVQTVWLAIADLVYRRSNLEHAAASLENILQSLVLIALLCLPVVAYATPSWRLGWIHPTSLLIPVFYLYGLRLVRRLRREPMWRARDTAETSHDEPDGADVDGTSTRRLWWRLASLAAVVAGTGYLIGEGGLGVVAATGLPSGLIALELGKPIKDDARLAAERLVGFTLTTAISGPGRRPGASRTQGCRLRRRGDSPDLRRRCRHAPHPGLRLNRRPADGRFASPHGGDE